MLTRKGAVVSLPELFGCCSTLLLRPRGQGCYQVRLADREGRTILLQQETGSLLWSAELLERLGLHLLIEGEEVTDVRGESGRNGGPP